MNTKLKPEIQTELEEIVSVIINTVNTEEIYLFGSFSRGEERDDSDFDIFVVLDDDEDRKILCRQKVYRALIPLNERGFDILTEYNSKFYNEKERGYMAKIVLAEGVKLYGRSKIA